ncbi:hypothetical protein ES692_17315 [Psychroserpens burtonensis]|uniref:Uncharacterized protein n=1 Tax=Psychroserpens burtonensis TaxID=49278 RepID=A0A5C7B645_9FLAO|nr:hypothetical protein [Psychroserpens burtonensis]TXE15294.1 hypothetical protein ES692_17315 [Psychroserpens burtonensis]
MASAMYIDKNEKVVFEINGPNYVQADIEFKKNKGNLSVVISNSDDVRFNGDYSIISNKLKKGGNVVHEIVLTSSKIKILAQRVLGKSV